MRFMWIFALALLAAGAAQAQTQSPYCQHLQDRIQAMQTSLVGLQNLVSNENFTLLQCALDPNMPNSEEQFYGCLDNPGAQGIWHDAETQTIYVVYTKDFVRNLAAERGLGPADIQRSFSISDSVRSKIAYGGVIDSLAYEIQAWQASYRDECGGTRPGEPGGPGSDCLLGVCP